MISAKARHGDTGLSPSLQTIEDTLTRCLAAALSDILFFSTDFKKKIIYSPVFILYKYIYLCVCARAHAHPYTHTHTHTQVFPVCGVASPGHRPLSLVVAVHTEATRSLCSHHKLCSVWNRETWPLESLCRKRLAEWDSPAI